MSNDKIEQNFRPTPYPSMLDFTFLDLTRHAAERKKLLEQYTGALATWTNNRENEFPTVGEFWKQHATGLIHRVVAVAYAGSSDHQHQFNVIHETKDGATFSTGLVEFLCGKIEYSIASHDYGEEVPEAPAFEKFEGTWDEPEIEVRRRYRPLDAGKAMQKLHETAYGDFWVVNAMRTKHGVPEIIVDCSAPDDKAGSLLRIPDTWLPINLSVQTSYDRMKNNTRLLRLINNGNVRVIRKKFAEDLLNTPEAILEHKRLLARGYPVEIIGPSREPVVVPEKVPAKTEEAKPKVTIEAVKEDK